MPSLTPYYYILCLVFLQKNIKKTSIYSQKTYVNTLDF